MIAEIIPEAYEATGVQVSAPFNRRRRAGPTFPMGRYISQPLAMRCASINDIRKFLSGCRYVSDKELFAKDDYWQPPEDFEKRKKGDCEDFALWTWRQLLSLGFEARFVVGSSGRYGDGHAWVEYFQDGKCYLVEPLACRIGYTLPRLSTCRYVPRMSVSWNGKALKYFSHKKPDQKLGWRVLSPLVLEYLPFWAFFWLVNLFRFPQLGWRFLRRGVLSREL